MALAVILAGGFVRIHDAGESCPDWPTCFGTLGFDVSEEEQDVWFAANPDKIDSRGEAHRYSTFEIFTEWFHRLLATASGAVVIVGLIIVHRNREALSDENWYAAKVSLVVVISQGLLGAITVIFDNESWSVALHLTLALAYTGWLFWWWLLWRRDVDLLPNLTKIDDESGVKEIKTFKLGILVSSPVLLLGVWIATGEGGAYNQGCSVGWWQGWPLCQGSLFPEIFDNIAIFVAWIHRIAVIIVGVVLVKSFIDMKNRLVSSSKNLQWIFGLGVLAYLLNILVGGLYVVLAKDGFPELLSLLHLNLGSDVILLFGIGYAICSLKQEGH